MEYIECLPLHDVGCWKETKHQLLTMLFALDTWMQTYQVMQHVPEVSKHAVALCLVGVFERQEVCHNSLVDVVILWQSRCSILHIQLQCILDTVLSDQLGGILSNILGEELGILWINTQGTGSTYTHSVSLNIVWRHVYCQKYTNEIPNPSNLNVIL